MNIAVPKSPFSGVNRWLKQIDEKGNFYKRDWSYSHVLSDYVELWTTHMIYLYEDGEMVASFKVKFENDRPVDILHEEVVNVCHEFWKNLFLKAVAANNRYPLTAFICHVEK